MVEGFSLRLVNGDRPREAKRKLREAADGIGGDFAAIQPVAIHFPRVRINGDEVVVVGQAHVEVGAVVFVAFHGFDHADAAIHPAPLRIVVDEHDLRTEFELQLRHGGKKFLAEITADNSVGAVQFGGKCRQMFGVDFISLAIGGGEADEKFLGVGLIMRVEPLVEMRDVVVIGGIGANAVQQVDEFLLLLAIDFIQFHNCKIGLAQAMGAEEIRRFVMLAENFLRLAGNNGRQLIKVADKNHLHPAERLVFIGTIEA